MAGILGQGRLSLLIALSSDDHVGLLAQETVVAGVFGLILSGQRIVLAELTLELRCFVDGIRLCTSVDALNRNV